MNWFDFVLIGLVVVGAIVGLRIGIIGAAFTAVGGVAGFFFARARELQVGAQSYLPQGHR